MYLHVLLASTKSIQRRKSPRLEFQQKWFNLNRCLGKNGRGRGRWRKGSTAEHAHMNYNVRRRDRKRSIPQKGAIKCAHLHLHHDSVLDARARCQQLSINDAKPTVQRAKGDGALGPLNLFPDGFRRYPELVKPACISR